MAAKKYSYQVKAGLDIGNGYVKGLADVFSSQGTKQYPIDTPSSAAYVSATHDIKVSVSEIPAIIEDITNEMDAHFESDLVPDSNRRLFGRRGLMSGLSVEEFDVYSSISKAKQPLSAMLTLSSIAGVVLRAYYDLYNELPDDVIEVSVKVALALPIGEYKKYRREYADGYMKKPHIIEIHNFDTPIRMVIKFDNVQVIAEGASAHYALMDKGEPFMTAMLTDLRARAPQVATSLEGITGADVCAAQNTVGIDIGEGTVNFPVFQNGRFNPDASVTFDKGYGAVLNNALERLQDEGYPFGSRKELQDFLNTPPTAISKRRYAIIQDITDQEIKAFVGEVAMQFSKVMNRIGAYLEVVYVYGGGASALQSDLYPALLEKVSSFSGGEVMIPILYLDSRYSRYLNREGLHVLADKLP